MCNIPRMNPNGSYALWLMMCQSRFINCNICTSLKGDVDNGGDCSQAEVGEMWEISAPSAQFFSKLKTALKTDAGRVGGKEEGQILSNYTT